MAPVVALALLLATQTPDASACVPGQPTEACEHALLMLSLNLEEQLHTEQIDRVRAEKKLLQCTTSNQAPAPPDPPAPRVDVNLPVWAWVGAIILASGATAFGTWELTR